jgi:hypothetical protein
MPTLPFHTVLSGQDFVKTFYPGALNAAQLTNGATLRRGFAKTHVVHLADNSEASIRVESQPCLMKQAIGAGTSRLAGGIETDARFADPHQKAANPRGKGNRRVGNPRPRFQHQACQPTYGDVGANTGFIDNNEGAVEDIDLAPFDEQYGGTVFDRDGAGRREAGHRSHHDQELQMKRTVRNQS